MQQNHSASASSGAVITATDLTKTYTFHQQRAGLLSALKSVVRRTTETRLAVDAIDLTIRSGEMVGLLGPNGAGKTTTLKLVTGLLKPTAGAGWIFGEPITRPESRRRLGFLPEQPYFYDYLNGVEYLELAGRLSGLSGRDASSRAREWLGRVGLGEKPRLLLRKYSKGMLQRLGLAASLVHEPELLILDEPMSGLDPFGRRDVRELILEQRAHGTTILFSSHILPDVEMLCDRVAIVLRGRLARTATLHDLMEDRAHGVEIRCIGSPLLELPPAWREQVRRAELPDGTALKLSDAGMLDEVLAWLVARGIRVRAITPQRASLEDLLLESAEEAPQRRAGGAGR